MFLHGFLSNKESFNYQIEYFSKFRRVIAIDVTGFGESKELPFAYALSDYILDINKVLNALDVKSYDIIAHSFGGRLAIKMAVNDDKIDKLVLTGAAGLKPRRSLKFYFKVFGYKLLKPFLNQKQKEKFGSKEYRAISGELKKSYLKIVNEHLDNLSKQINNKTLLVFGENDLETPLYMAKRLNRNIKNSALYIIKGAGHFSFIDKPNEFNIITGEFLRE